MLRIGRAIMQTNDVISHISKNNSTGTVRKHSRGQPPEIVALDMDMEIGIEHMANLHEELQSDSLEDVKEDNKYMANLRVELQTDSLEDIEEDNIDMANLHAELQSDSLEDVEDNTSSEEECSEGNIDPEDILESALEVSEDNMLSCVKHPHSGYCWNLSLEENEEENNSKHRDNPYYLWANAEELWICDILFRKGHVLTKVADEILGAIASSRLCTREPIRFKNSCEI
jgi:hypothetical protein